MTNRKNSVKSECLNQCINKKKKSLFHTFRFKLFFPSALDAATRSHVSVYALDKIV